MKAHAKAAIWQGAIFIGCTVLAFGILVSTDVVSRFAYLVEKGRIQAVRESLPDAAELERFNANARAVAAVVRPGVVQIVTEKRYSLRDLLDMHQDAAVDTSGLADRLDPDGDADSSGRDAVRIRDGFGSGFIVDADQGYIVTNNHVIDGADAIRVHLSDGRRVDARLLGADPKTDVAVLQIQADRLHALPLADSDLVEVGDDVLSVGSPFGLDGSVSRGIVSAKGRSSIDIHGVEYKGFLQTDAVINPGNSGGPLVNLRGEVIAINTAIATEVGHYDGVGFAIPARRVRQMLPALVRGEAVPRGYLGVSIVNAVDNTAMTEPLGWEETYGVIVREVLPDSPAARDGLQPGDVILSIDGAPLRQTADLIDMVGDSAPGAELILRIWRDRAEITRTVKVDRQPENFTTRPRLR